MEFKKGNMWDSYTESQLFMITTNSYVRKDGELVMGRGIAQQVKRRYSDLPKIAGNWILQNDFHMMFYGIMIDIFDSPVGLFQVKYHYADAALLKLIDVSSEMLAFVIKERGLTNVNLNFPGIGAGRLSRESVLPVLEKHFTDVPIGIWEYD